MKNLTPNLITLFLRCRILLPDTLQGEGEVTLLSLDDCNESYSLYILWKPMHFSFLTCLVGSACSSQGCSRRALVYLESHLLSTSPCRGLWCLQVFQFTLGTAEPSLQALNFRISKVNHPARMGTKARLRSSGGCRFPSGWKRHWESIALWIEHWW